MKVIKDIRQSNAWSEYLSEYSWKSFELDENIIVRTSNILFFNKASVLRPKPLTLKNLESIELFCIQKNVKHIKISPNINQDLNLLRRYKYKKSNSIELPPKTMVIDLEKPMEALWDNLTSKGRYNIRKAGRDLNHVKFTQNPGNKKISSFYNTLKRRSRKKGFYVQSKKKLEARIKPFRNEVYIADVYSKKGVLLGTKLFLGFNSGIWGIYAATTPAGQKSCGGYKLLWESFGYFKQKGYKQMDLEGMYDKRFAKLAKNWKGYTYFKKQFNGEILEYPKPFTKSFIGKKSLAKTNAV